MAHASGNPTWEDYPNLTTLVTAASLENIEALLDVLYNPPSFIARASAAFPAASGFNTMPLGTTVLDTHGWKSGNTYVPQRAGYYLALASFTQGQDAGVAWPNCGVACSVRKNNAAIDPANTDLPFIGGFMIRGQNVELVHCNGTTDAISGMVYQDSGTSRTVASAALQCWWYRP